MQLLMHYFSVIISVLMCKYYCFITSVLQRYYLINEVLVSNHSIMQLLLL